MTWKRSFPVRFGDVDPARVVYYPRLYDLLHRAFEDFWEDALGRPYPQVLAEDKAGYPAVHIETDFRAPLRYGDRFEVEIAIERVGTRSVTWRYRGFLPGRKEPFVETAITTACVDMDTFKPRDIPTSHRRLFETWGVRHQSSR